MIGWGRGRAQNASSFSAMARDGDGRERDLVGMGIRSGDICTYYIDHSYSRVHHLLQYCLVLPQ